MDVELRGLSHTSRVLVELCLFSRHNIQKSEKPRKSEIDFYYLLTYHRLVVVELNPTTSKYTTVIVVREELRCGIPSVVAALPTTTAT